MRGLNLIALLLPESKQDAQHDSLNIEDTTALVRDDEGRMSLQPVTSEMTRAMPFKEQVMTTGCFRRGKPIIDPMTREVIGYEMEMLSALETRLANTRLELGLSRS